MATVKLKLNDGNKEYCVAILKSQFEYPVYVTFIDGQTEVDEAIATQILAHAVYGRSISKVAPESSKDFVDKDNK